MNKVGKLKFLYLYLFVLTTTLGIVYSHATTERWGNQVDGLRLSIYTPTPEYKDPNAFQLSVLFENVGKEKIVILPQSIRRNYESRGHGAAEYVPYPGPRIYPLKDAFTLLPGQRNEINFVGMRDGDGIWKLEPGTYDLSVRYTVSQDLVLSYARDLPDVNARIWAGTIESGKSTIKFEP